MSSPLNEKSPFILRFNEWAKERFPIVNVITGIVIYVMVLAVGRTPGMEGKIPFYWTDLLGAWALICQFLLLRVLDEHKDYAEDCINHPQRALQRGLITLNHLKAVGVGAALFQLLYSIWIDGGIKGAVIAWVAMTAWTLLMAKEFGCPKWLKSHLILYAFSHMLIMPFTIIWALSLVGSPWPLTQSSVVLIVLTLVSGFAFEITRKTRGKEEERQTLDSYSKIWGSHGAAVVIIGLLIGILAAQLKMISFLVPKTFTVGYGFIFFGFLASVVAVLYYLRNPTMKARKLNEGATGIFMLINYVNIIVAAIGTRGWLLK